MHRFVLWLANGAILVTSSSWVMLSAESVAVGIHGSVTSIPAGELIRKPANFFDLEGTTVTFTPNGTDGYTVRVGALDWEDHVGTQTWDNPHNANWGHLESPTVDLPFAFPFAGRTWTRAYANVHGNISFLQPESKHWPQREGDTMRGVAAAIDSRSATELEAMVAALWARYDDTTISIDSTSSRVAITWRAVRQDPPGGRWYEPLGENLFQARLYPSGVVELAYRTVAERDGIVGLFHGMNDHGRMLDTADDGLGDASTKGNAVVDISRIELVDRGSTVLVRINVAGDVPNQVPDGTIDYRFILEFGDYSCAAGVGISQNGTRGFTWCASPGVVGYRVHGTTVEIAISKVLLHGSDHFSWNADAVWWGRAFDQVFESRPVSVAELDYDLSAMPGTVPGNTFEVFHHPSILKNPRQVMSLVYSHAPANVEIAVPFTDFRTDALYGGGPGSGPINTPVQGIGDWQARPTSGTEFRSDSLLVTMVPTFIGAPLFSETGMWADLEFRDFGRGISWIAHEAVHRWAAHLKFRNPHSGRIESLTDERCRCHWSRFLHAPVVHAVGQGYSSGPYLEHSVMGGSIWSDNGDGTFTRAATPGSMPYGMSALDLYVMGMIPPTQVPDTFLLDAADGVNPWGTIKAMKVPVRIEDIVAAMGPREPASDASRRDFRLGVYLLHEDGRPPRADLLERAQALTATIPEYFATATGGRMQVVPTASTEPAAPSGHLGLPPVD